jgi:hypothetical protein
MLKATSSIVNVSQITGVLPVVNGGTGVTTSTGTGNTVLSAAPTLSGNVTLSTGNLIVASGQGVDFSATPGTGTSELLADYEEGAWTPTITASTTNPTITYTRQRGRYTKIGRIVTLECDMIYSAFSGGSGNVQVSGAPFTIDGSVGTGGAGAISVMEGFVFVAGRTFGGLYASPGSTDMLVQCLGSGVSTEPIGVASMNPASGRIVFTLSYSVA